MFETPGDRPTRRRALWIGIPALGAVGILWWQRESDASAAASGLPPASGSGEEISIVEFSDAGARLGSAQVRKIVLSDSAWRKRLTAEQYYVTRNHSTDQPFTGTYFQMHEHGLFRCICCNTALFSSLAKYDSGSGWPAFTEPIAIEDVREVSPPGLSRQAALDIGIEVLCKRCDAHLGHIFDDGPPPANLRYCINESSLRFVRRSG